MHDAPSSRSNLRRCILPAVALCGLLWGGCSLERDYAMLSFFFDGVPAPMSESEAEALSSAGGASGGSAGSSSIVSAHSAYRERRCAECHGERARFGFQTAGFSDLSERLGL